MLFRHALMALTLVLPAFGQAREFRFWTRLPQTSLSCEAQASALAERFEQATRTTPNSVRCLGSARISAEGQVYALESIELTYAAREELEAYVAVLGSGQSDEPSDNMGAYNTFADCLADLAKQSAAFQQHTRLTAVSATCEKAGMAYRSPYVLKVSGFGIPAKRLYAAELVFYTEMDEQLRQRILGLYALNGASLARVNDMRVLYYSKNPVRIRRETPAYFPHVSQCQSQEADFRGIIARNGAKNAIVRCLKGPAGRFALEGAHDSARLLSSDFGTRSPRYYSFEECLADRERMLNDSVSRGAAPLGGLCLPALLDNTQFKLEIFEPL